MVTCFSLLMMMMCLLKLALTAVNSPSYFGDSSSEELPVADKCDSETSWRRWSAKARACSNLEVVAAFAATELVSRTNYYS